MPEFLRGLTIFKMSFISSFDIINVVPGLEAQDPNILWIPASTAEAAAVNPDDTNTHLATILHQCQNDF